MWSRGVLFSSRGVLEGRSPSNEIIHPLPLDKGKGIKGIGLLNQLRLRLV